MKERALRIVIMSRIAAYTVFILAFPLVVWSSENLSRTANPESPAMTAALTQDEEILVSAPRKQQFPRDQTFSYSIKSGGAFAVYDSDFRDFLDYGLSVSLGAKKKIKEKISFLASLEVIMLRGEWDTGSNRESIIMEAEETFPGNNEPGVTAEDINDKNLGSSNRGEGEAIITSAELLRRVDLDTTLYIVPLSFNIVYEHHGGDKKRINPYIGGGLGFCMATREVESDAIREQSYQGSEYRIRLDDSETVFGQLLQVFAGIYIPFKNNIRLVAEAGAAMYDLDNFDPVLEVSYKTRDPDYYEGDDMSSYNPEDPVKIGVFEQEIISTFSIGVVIPF
jgi:hypothetical protein